jgi:hypothetical protein
MRADRITQAADLSAVARALAATRRAEKQLELTRAELHHAIADALADGARQADLVHFTGYSREHIRRIAREAGIKADR